ncbi:PLC-like phosphodiesterase [Piedraia hortae CBS 480.64]|uniref:PLC-like phosphodiesterase n=1 Tax=Piedraia hortae CBS 480.64 TaxID=1314780 RepID=A0A6A7BSG0_9PEZI|nr:PLC-like phosphodiesterase [Piedraia hortae CBS 480.64]
MFSRPQSRKANTVTDVEKGHANPQGHNWMSFLPDSTKPNKLTIPGTHDSTTYLSSIPYVKTQTLSIPSQLNLGVRFFDLRCRLNNNGIPILVHGRASLGITLAEVLQDVYTWLEHNPTEGVIVMIKHELDEASLPDKEGSKQFALAISTLVHARKEAWVLGRSTPRLGHLRGKVQLFRRFRCAGPLGVDLSGWVDNSPVPFVIRHVYRRHKKKSLEKDGKPPKLVSLRFTIQDHYTPLTPLSLPDWIIHKGAKIRELLRLAALPSLEDGEDWFINFTSAYEFNWYYQCTPRAIAVGGYHFWRWYTGVNVRVEGFLKTETSDTKGKRRRYGVIKQE